MNNEHSIVTAIFLLCIKIKGLEFNKLTCFHKSPLKTYLCTYRICAPLVHTYTSSFISCYLTLCAHSCVLQYLRAKMLKLLLLLYCTCHVLLLSVLCTVHTCMYIHTRCTLYTPGHVTCIVEVQEV